jgi:hypothetical protein
MISQVTIAILGPLLDSQTSLLELREGRFGTLGTHFGISGRSFWHPWVHFATQGPPGDPKGEKSEQNCQNVVRGPFPGPPKGTPNPQKTEKMGGDFVDLLFHAFRVAKGLENWAVGVARI